MIVFMFYVFKFDIQYVVIYDVVVKVRDWIWSRMRSFVRRFSFFLTRRNNDESQTFRLSHFSFRLKHTNNTKTSLFDDDDGNKIKLLMQLKNSEKVLNRKHISISISISRLIVRYNSKRIRNRIESNRIESNRISIFFLNRQKQHNRTHLQKHKSKANKQTNKQTKKQGRKYNII